MRLKYLLAAAALVATALSGLSSPAAAETAFRPVMVVNDSVITGFDLAQRVQILKALDSPASSPEALRSHALDQLVNERLKLQEADRMGVQVTPEMVQAGVEAFARQAGMKPDAFRALLSAQGVSELALEDMARATVGWGRVIQMRFGDSAASDGANTGAGATTEFRLLEIGLTLHDEDRSAAETRALAERLSRELGAGGDFSQAAVRYSETPSAADGGNVGWVSTAQMPQDLRRTVRELDVGEVSQPLEVTGGLAIIKVVDKRTVAGASAPGRTLAEGAARRARDLLQNLRQNALIDTR